MNLPNQVVMECIVNFFFFLWVSLRNENLFKEKVKKLFNRITALIRRSTSIYRFIFAAIECKVKSYIATDAFIFI